MFIGEVIGNVVSTIKHENFDGRKLMLVQPVTPEGKPWKEPLICIDIVGAGPGERVLFVDEGNSARDYLGLPLGSVRAVIVGIIDEVQLANTKDGA